MVDIYNIYFYDLDTIFTDCYIRNMDDLMKRKLLLHNNFDKLDKISLNKAIKIINEKPIICWGANCGIFDCTNKLIIDTLIEKGANPENILVPYRKLGAIKGLSVVVNKLYKPLNHINMSDISYKELRYMGFDALEYEILQLYTYYTLSFISLRSINYRIEHYNNTIDARIENVKQRFKDAIQDSITKLRESDLGCAEYLIKKLYAVDNLSDAIRCLTSNKKELKADNEVLYKDILRRLRHLKQLELDLDNSSGYIILGANIPEYTKDSSTLTNRPITIIERYESYIINEIPKEYKNITIVAPAWQVTNDLSEAIQLVTYNGKYPFEITEELNKDYIKNLVAQRFIAVHKDIDICKRNKQLNKVLHIVKQCYNLGIYVRSIEDDKITFAIKDDETIIQRFMQIACNAEFESKISKIIIHSNTSDICTIRTYKNKYIDDIKELYIKEK